MTSQIEQMIDKACGYDPNKANQFGSNSIDTRTETLLALADAAVRWRRVSQNHNFNLDDYTDSLGTLCKAIDAWIDVGG